MSSLSVINYLLVWGVIGSILFTIIVVIFFLTGVIYAAVENHLADIEVGDVRRFEEAWLDFVRQSHAEILDELRTEKTLTDELRKKLEAAVAAFKETFA